MKETEIGLEIDPQQMDAYIDNTVFKNRTCLCPLPNPFLDMQNFCLKCGMDANPPAYSTNMGDAYRVIKRMSKNGYTMDIRGFPSMYTASFLEPLTGVSYQAAGKSLPEIVCIAALAAMTKETE